MTSNQQETTRVSAYQKKPKKERREEKVMLLGASCWGDHILGAHPLSAAGIYLGCKNRQLCPHTCFEAKQRNAKPTACLIVY
jgi:hypothetical protein